MRVSIIGVSINPILTRGSRLCPPHYCLPTRIWKPNGITAVMMMILMMTMMCLCGAHACFHNFFRSSSRPQNRAAVEARSTRPTRRMAAMARRYVFIYTYILHMLLIYALHDSRIKKRRRRRQLWRSILESGFLSFKVSPPVLSKVPFVFLSVPHWSRKLQKYCSTCNAMQNVSFAWTYFRNRVYWRVKWTRTT